MDEEPFPQIHDPPRPPRRPKRNRRLRFSLLALMLAFIASACLIAWMTRPPYLDVRVEAIEYESDDETYVVSLRPTVYGNVYLAQPVVDSDGDPMETVCYTTHPRGVDGKPIEIRISDSEYRISNRDGVHGAWKAATPLVHVGQTYRITRNVPLKVLAGWSEKGQYLCQELRIQ